MFSRFQSGTLHPLLSKVRIPRVMTLLRLPDGTFLGLTCYGLSEGPTADAARWFRPAVTERRTCEIVSHLISKCRLAQQFGTDVWAGLPQLGLSRSRRSQDLPARLRAGPVGRATSPTIQSGYKSLSPVRRSTGISA